MTQWHHERMNAYSEDLRKKIIEALRRGMAKSEAARTFSVSLSSVKRYAKMAHQGHPLAPRRGPAPNPRQTRMREGCWRPTWSSARPLRSQKGDSSWRGYAGLG